MTCNARPFIGLFHQASTFCIHYWGALLISIGSIRYCNADVYTAPFIKGICTWCLEQHFSPKVSQQPRDEMWCFELDHCLYSLLQCSICSVVPWYWVLLRIPFLTNALYAIVLVSLTIQDTPGKFDDIAAVYCVCMGKRNRNIWFSLIILQDDLSHFPMQRADPPSTVSIRYWSAFRCQHCLYPLLQCWCWYQTIHERNVLDERYSSQMDEARRSCLWFSFSFVQNYLKCSTIHWSVPPSKHFLYTLLGALHLSIGSIRYCNDDVDTGPFIKGIWTWCLEWHFSPIVSQQPCNKLWCFGWDHCLYSLLQCSICSLVPWYWVFSNGVLFEPTLYTPLHRSHSQCRTQQVSLMI